MVTRSMRLKDDRGPMCTIARAPHPKKPHPKKTVLVVDDDENVREPIVLLLEHEGYEVALAPDGQGALDLLRQGIVPSVIVLDLMMPVMTGWEFRRRQLADPALAAVPVLVVSADPEASALAESPGVRGVLAKPVDVEVLLQSLAGICG